MDEATADALNTEVVEAVNEGMRYAHCSCGIEFQRKHVEKLGAMRDRLKKIRYEFIGQSNEPYANAAFHAQMLVSGVQNFLEMWVLLKQDEPAEAWNKLVAAQNDFEIAQRILFLEETQAILMHLLAVERVVFPPQSFFSSGYTYLEAFCTICNKRYGDCDHVRGRIYMGQICRRRIPKSKVTEFSIVFEPSDKRCRIAEYVEDSKVYCTLTRREIPQAEPVDPSVMYVSGTVQYFD
jgi:hypothetical protein